MSVKFLLFAQPVLPHFPFSSETLVSPVSSSSSKQRSHISNGGREGGPLVCRFVHRLDSSSLFQRSRSCEYTLSASKLMRTTCSARLEYFSDEEFSKNIKDSDDHDRNTVESFEQPHYGGDENTPADIERIKNIVEVPFPLWKEGFREAGESVDCSVKKAFSSMMFIIQELHSHTLQMQEILLFEDLQGILAHVQTDMHASFARLFQQVFSPTPTLMIYVMILLANFTVHSMSHNAAIAAAAMEISPPSEIQNQKNQKFDSSSEINNFSVSSSSGKAGSINGNNSGKFPPASEIQNQNNQKFDSSAAINSGGEDGFDWNGHDHRTILLEGASELLSLDRTEEDKEIREECTEEANLWNSMVEEARKMEGGFRDGGLEWETMKRFVSSVKVVIEPDDDYEEYLRTELVYLGELSQEPCNKLVLANYAQFLYLVAHDYDRAEHYFKRAIEKKKNDTEEATDAETYHKYAMFLWKAKNDLSAAEATFPEAISAEPSNSYYAASHAHFLWNTGAKDTCPPLTSPHPPQQIS